MQIDPIKHIEKHNSVPVEFKIGNHTGGLWIPEGQSLAEEEIKKYIRKYVQIYQRKEMRFNEKWDGTFEFVNREEKIQQMKDFIKKMDNFNPAWN